MSAFETWIKQDDQGQYVLITENDGARYIRRGPETHKRILDPNDASDARRIERYKQSNKEVLRE